MAEGQRVVGLGCDEMACMTFDRLTGAVATLRRKEGIEEGEREEQGEGRGIYAMWSTSVEIYTYRVGLDFTSFSLVSSMFSSFNNFIVCTLVDAWGTSA